MISRRSGSLLMAVNTLVASLVLSSCGWPYASAQELPSDKPVPDGASTMAASGMGRLYVFREVRSFGAHIDDYVTVNGVVDWRPEAGPLRPISHSMFGSWSQVMEQSACGNIVSPKRTASPSGGALVSTSSPHRSRSANEPLSLARKDIRANSSVNPPFEIAGKRSG
jgi:hypothetical protein